jgi:hypothetical protein
MSARYKNLKLNMDLTCVQSFTKVRRMNRQFVPHTLQTRGRILYLKGLRVYVLCVYLCDIVCVCVYVCACALGVCSVLVCCVNLCVCVCVCFGLSLSLSLSLSLCCVCCVCVCVCVCVRARARAQQARNRRAHTHGTVIHTSTVLDSCLLHITVYRRWW